MLRIGLGFRQFQTKVGDMDWQPIDTMPTEGCFLAWCPFSRQPENSRDKMELAILGRNILNDGGRMIVAAKLQGKRKRPGKNIKDVNSPIGEQHYATHWTPLPVPPPKEDMADD